MNRNGSTVMTATGNATAARAPLAGAPTRTGSAAGQPPAPRRDTEPGGRAEAGFRTPPAGAAGDGPAPARIPDSRLVLYHPTTAGNGSALRFEPRQRQAWNGRPPCVFLEMAAQKTAPGKDGDRTIRATFDWENRITVKLEFADLGELLAVLEGRSEKAGGARNGLYHDSGRANTLISLQRQEGRGGCLLGLSRKDKTSNQLNRVSFVLSESEALGLAILFRAAMIFLVFPPATGVMDDGRGTTPPPDHGEPR